MALREKDTQTVHKWLTLIQTLVDYLPKDVDPPMAEDPQRANKNFNNFPRFPNDNFGRYGKNQRG